MNALSTAAALALLIILGAEAVDFQRSAVCRQEAWLRAIEMLTEAKLSKVPNLKTSRHLKCVMRVWRLGNKSQWQRRGRTHLVGLELPGTL